jgi:predicted aminopeptidase
MAEKTCRGARRWAAGLLLAGIAAGLCGCRTVSFYAQALKGQYQILTHQRSIETFLKDPQTPENLRLRFELLQELREFAHSNLDLQVDGHYRKYVDVHRQFVVWNVEAAPEFSMQPKSWSYPLVGSLEYRGYFSKYGATNYAAYLRKRGYDVTVGGVEAYSTLGWFKDPVLNTFIFEPDAELAELLFHELAHQRVFARGDTDFNEAFATAVGQEGARRWLRSRGNATNLEQYEIHLGRTRQFVQLTLRARSRLESLYGDTRDAAGKVRSTARQKEVPVARLREEKQQVMQDLKHQFSDLKESWGGGREYNGWFGGELNNAHLNSIAAYYEFAPAFERLLEQSGHDMGKFLAAAKKLAKQPKAHRHEQLRQLAETRSSS